MSDISTPGVVLAALTHDLIRKRSIVVLAWPNDPERKLALPVPYGCTLEVVRDEAEKAMRELSAETATLVIQA